MQSSTDSLTKPLRVCRTCGLEAWNTEDLDKFCNDKASKYKKRNLCLECNKKYLKAYKPKPPKPKPKYLRKCKDCGLEAHSEADLKLFRFHKNRPHRRDNWCLICYNEYQREKQYVKKGRDKQKEALIETFSKPMKCYFCGDPITVLKGKSAESIAIHSLDGNHENWKPENKTPSHRSCHSRHHAPKTGPKIHYSEYLKAKKRGEI